MFRVVQVIKSLQGPLEMGNNLPGSMIMSENEAWNRNVFKCRRKFDRDGADITGQAVPHGESGDWEGPAADGRQFHGRYRHTIGPSRAEGTSTRHVIFLCTSVFMLSPVY